MTYNTALDSRGEGGMNLKSLITITLGSNHGHRVPY